MGQTAVTVVLSTARRGRMQLPVRIRIFGSDADPLECVMSARSIGPALEFFQADQPKEKRSTRAHLDFGSCPVLRANTRVLNIFNPCPVPASFKAFVESPTSVFSISPREGLLQPGATLAVDVMCTMDDTRKFTDLLHVLVQVSDGDVRGCHCHVQTSVVAIDGLLRHRQASPDWPVPADAAGPARRQRDHNQCSI